MLFLDGRSKTKMKYLHVIVGDTKRLSCALQGIPACTLKIQSTVNGDLLLRRDIQGQFQGKERAVIAIGTIFAICC